MKKKELKNLAQKIAKCEKIIQYNEDPYEVKRAQERIFELSKCVNSLEDITIIDEIVQEILEKK